MARTRVEIPSWRVRKVADDEASSPSSTSGAKWYTIGAAPSSVHTVLMAAGELEDPFMGRNETMIETQVIGEAKWLYQTTFATPAKPGLVDLVAEGLDTFADIFVNGQKVGSSENAFVPLRLEISGALVKSGENTLDILFHSSFIRARELEEKHGKREVMLGDSSRVAVRKMQSQWGWDWGPTLVTSGPWKPAYFEAYTSRLSGTNARAEVARDLKTATIYVEATTLSSGLQVEYTLTDAGGKVRGSTTFANGAATVSLAVGKDDLWWPRGYGKQPLFTSNFKLLTTSGEVLDTVSHTTGLRKIDLVQEPYAEEAGKSFFFRVNNVDIFATGSDWINADSFLDRVTSKDYQEWIELAAAGNQNMIRVWGGGIYEDDAFYDACDRLGLLVWQDFCFACASYPAHGDFLKVVQEELNAQITRLRHHPSLCIWVGNNENDMLISWLKWSKESKDADALYLDLMPKAVKALSPDIAYWPSSPYGPDDKDPNSQLEGDIHQWSVWHMEQLPYTDYGKLAGRFVSEFGMMGAPDIRTTLSYLPKDAHAQDIIFSSHLMEQHNKCDDQARRLAVYLADNIPYANDLRNYTYATQVIQSEALTEAYRQWRLRWRKDGLRQTGGVLVWQLNDCWPTTSWAIVDYFKRPKMSYFAVKRESAPFSAFIEKIYPWGDFVPEKKHSANTVASVNFRVSVMSMELAGRRVKLTVDAWDTLSDGPFSMQSSDGRTLKCVLPEPDKVHEIAPNGTTDVADIIFGPVPVLGPVHPKLVIRIGVTDASTGELLARTFNWAQPLKFHHLLDPELKIEISGDSVTVTATRRPAKAVWLDVAEDDSDLPKWSDNGFDLFTGESINVIAKGLNGRKLTARWLGDHL